MKLADEDGDKLLSVDEIKKFCEACLERYVKPDSSEFLKEMILYFTKLIFESLGYSQTDKIPLLKLRDHILQNGENSHLLTMFCGADF
jgi:hypothetical protein